MTYVCATCRALSFHSCEHATRTGRRRFVPSPAHGDARADTADVETLVSGLCPAYNAPTFEGQGVYDRQPTTTGTVPARRVEVEHVASRRRVEREHAKRSAPRSPVLARVIAQHYAELVGYAERQVGEQEAADVVQAAIADLHERGYSLEGVKVRVFGSDDDAVRVLYGTVENRIRRRNVKRQKALERELSLPRMEPVEADAPDEVPLVRRPPRSGKQGLVFPESDGVDGGTEGRSRYAPQRQTRRVGYDEANAARSDLLRALEAEGVDWIEGAWLASVSDEGFTGLTREDFREYCRERFGDWGDRAFESLRWRCDRLKANLRKRLNDWKPVERGGLPRAAPRYWPLRPTLFDRMRRDVRDQFIARMSGNSA